MRNGGRSKKVALAALAAGALVVGGGCGKLTSSLDKKDTVTLADLQAQVATLQAQVDDLRAQVGQDSAAEPVDGPSAVIKGGRAGDLTDSGRGSTRTADQSGASRLAKGARAMVTADILNIRDSARVEANKVGSLQRGTMVEVLAVDGDWAKIRFSGNRTTVTGWVNTSYLRQEE